MVRFLPFLRNDEADETAFEAGALPALEGTADAGRAGTRPEGGTKAFHAPN
jgi:hypothetical protein